MKSEFLMDSSWDLLLESRKVRSWDVQLALEFDLYYSSLRTNLRKPLVLMD